ncbi:uncharacterized protein LOC135492532 [Lineus longissimus]|uniref:uncharacterized protein LOC135492532 n=1 Tax=Lineus longissimus TaxID=88925 RepID=UPI00315DF3CB
MALYSQALVLFLIVLSSSGVFTASLKQNKYDSDEEEQINLHVKKVHIIFMNHLDAGFTDYIDNVINLYFTQYFTQAVQRAAELAEGDYVETFRYTTHPWLVSMYLDCPKHIHLLPGDKVKCPSAEDIEVFTQAVKLGFITWHAGPMNMQYEFLDGALLAHAFNLTLSLDARFNITRKYRTLSQRDVPGMTQAVIPVLVKQGIAAITVGVNAATSPPAVPRIFNWEYNGQSVLAMWHPGGYPNNPGRNPKSPGGLSAKDCVTVDGFDEAMCFAFRSDNQGPPQSMEEIFGYYEILRRQFPNAKLGASSLEDFTAAVMSANIKLPTIRNEIGDTWIQGIQSDPRKVAEMRAVMRGRAECIQNGMCSYEDPRFFNSSRLLLKTGEHTWGYHGLSDQINWDNTAFQTVKNSTEFKNNTLGWMAQRQFTYLAVDALSDHPLAENITKEFDDMKPSKPDLTDYHSDTILLYKCSNGIQVGFDETTGSLNQVADPLKQIEWASDKNGLAKFHYNTYNQTDFDAMQTAYINDGWFDLGIDKPNITQNAHPESKVWEPTLAEFYRKKGGKAVLPVDSPQVFH